MVADSDGDVFAVADTDSRRVLFLDSNRELAGILYLDRLNTPVSALTDLCVSNGKVYVAGVRYKGDSDIVESERIVCYDRSGNQLSIPFETSEGKSARPSIKAMCESDDGVYVCRSTYELHEDSDDGKVTLFHLDEGGEARQVRETSDTADIFDIGVDPGDGSYVTLSQRGIIDDEYDLSVPNAQWPHVFLEVDLGTDEEVLAYDDRASGARRSPPSPRSGSSSCSSRSTGRPCGPSSPSCSCACCARPPTAGRRSGCARRARTASPLA